MKNTHHNIVAPGATKKMVESEMSFKKHEELGIYYSSDENATEDNRSFFDKNGYMIIKDIVDPRDLFSKPSYQRGKFSYYGSLDKFSYLPEEEQVRGSLSRYLHPEHKQYHNKVRLVLEKILKEKLYNTYYYDRFYYHHQPLFRHIDRETCEISISIQVSTNSNEPWPLCLETHEGKEVYINIENGWGILYKGCELEHWRNPMKSRYSKFQKTFRKFLKWDDDTYHHQMFFHYVRANGERSHFAGSN